MLDPKLNIIAPNHQACQTFLLLFLKWNPNGAVPCLSLCFEDASTRKLVFTTRKFKIFLFSEKQKIFSIAKQKAGTLSCELYLFRKSSLKGKHRGHFIWLKFHSKLSVWKPSCRFLGLSAWKLFVCFSVCLFVGLAFSRFSITSSGTFNEVDECMGPLMKLYWCGQQKPLEMWAYFALSSKLLILWKLI